MSFFNNKLFRSGIAAVALFLYLIQVAIVVILTMVAKPDLFNFAVHMYEIPYLAGGCLITILTVMYQSTLILQQKESLSVTGNAGSKDLIFNLVLICIISSLFFFLRAIEIKSILVTSILNSNLFVAICFPLVSILHHLIASSVRRFIPSPSFSFFSSDLSERKTLVSVFFTTHSFVINMCRRENKPLLIAGLEIVNISDVEQTYGIAGKNSLLEQVLLLLNEYSRNYERWGYDHTNSLFYNFFMISFSGNMDNIRKRIEPAFAQTNFAINGIAVKPVPRFYYICREADSLPSTAAPDENVTFLKKQIQSLRTSNND